MSRTLASRRFNTIGLPAFAALVLATAGCSSTQADRWLGAITPYRVDVMQGNAITQELTARVKPGMTREQVRDTLGSPLLTSPFHADRWDYVFTMRRQGVPAQRRSVVAHFKGDTLDRLEVPELPTEKEFVSSIRSSRPGGPEPLLVLSEEQRKALPPPAKGESTTTAQPLGANRPYPPLEAQ